MIPILKYDENKAVVVLWINTCRKHVEVVIVVRRKMMMMITIIIKTKIMIWMTKPMAVSMTMMVIQRIMKAVKAATTRTIFIMMMFAIIINAMIKNMNNNNKMNK